MDQEDLDALSSLRRHWPEYLMETGELAVYMFAACAFATLFQHPASPLRVFMFSPTIRRTLMGLAMGATVVALILSPWGKQSGGHFNPAITFTFYRLGKVRTWDLVYYIGGHFIGAVAGVALAALLLRGAPGEGAVRYALTSPGTYGSAVAFAAELIISFVLMTTILFVSNHAGMARFMPYFAGLLVAVYIALESPLSGMSTNPARSFGSDLYARYWHGLWIYFIAPQLGMLTAAELFLRVRHGKAPLCAKLDHANNKRCIFHHSGNLSGSASAANR